MMQQTESMESGHVWAVLTEMGAEFISAAESVLPRLVGAALLLALGWIVSRILRRVTVKLFGWSRVASLVDRSGLSESLERAGIGARLGELVGAFVSFLVFLVFLSAAADVMGWTVVSETLAMLTAYVPNLLAAGLILALALIVSRPAHAFFQALLGELDVPFAAGVASGARGAILIAGSFVALRQIGIDTRFLDSNVYMVVAGAVLVVALPLALGARLVVSNLVSGLYVRRLYRSGQEVCLGDRKATVKSINEVSVVFESDNGDVYVPHSQLISRGYQA